jgi:hypothetical protein
MHSRPLANFMARSEQQLLAENVRQFIGIALPKVCLLSDYAGKAALPLRTRRPANWHKN